MGEDQKRPLNWISRFGGRRFVLTVGCGAVNSFLLFMGKIGDEPYSLIILGTVGAYITGAVVQEVKQIQADKESS
jgi:hypothetical protein